MRHAFLFILMAILFMGCNLMTGGDRGYLTGVQNRPDYFEADPPGMVFIPMGSFTMGPSEQDIAYAQNAPRRTVTISPFYMDETEVTNNQYRQFVHWVRDSLARSLLADFDENFAFYEDEFGMPLDPPRLNWAPRIRWDGEEEQDILEELFLPESERFFRRRELDSRRLVFRYYTLDLERAARSTEDIPRWELVSEHETHIYPDTLVWMRDFTFAYNEPMTLRYFWHPSYDHYPVVGVDWEQAKAFNVWRTQYLNSYMASRNQPLAMAFQLPSEAQWEYAARGGLEGSPFPWGGPYLRNQEGCFLANFKPLRGNYAEDGSLFTAIVGHYPPNDYGLYDMAGNVSEWTRSAYDESYYVLSHVAHELNPDYQYNARGDDPPSLKRKVVRGGSWKDLGYYLQVSARTYEYQDTAKSYIGFRSIQSYPGFDRDPARMNSNVY